MIINEEEFEKMLGQHFNDNVVEIILKKLNNSQKKPIKKLVEEKPEIKHYIVRDVKDYRNVLEFNTASDVNIHRRDGIEMLEVKKL